MIDLQGAAVDVSRTRVGTGRQQEQSLITNLGETTGAGDDATEPEDLRIRRDRRQRISTRGGNRQRITQGDRGGAANHARGSDRGRGTQRD